MVALTTDIWTEIYRKTSFQSKYVTYTTYDLVSRVLFATVFHAGISKIFELSYFKISEFLVHRQRKKTIHMLA